MTFRGPLQPRPFPHSPGPTYAGSPPSAASVRDVWRRRGAMAAPRGPCGLCCGPAARCLPSHGRPVAAVRGRLPALGGGCGRQGPLPEVREPAAMREVRLEQAAKPCGLAVRSRRMSAVGGEGDRRWCCSFPRAPFQPGGGFSALLEAGSGVNAPADAFGQSPAHLAAGGGEACFLLWQLQTGADLNQQVTTHGCRFSRF